ncbi:MAG: hypothetical protein JWM41_3429 [Gemmatimonadetes bacterium]|nr:hypothetical protein [Gemmatimonadota bacterium]
MGQCACMTAQIQCSFGAAPAVLSVIPKGPPVQANSLMAATIMDNIPMANIPAFGTCNSMSNPVVAAATAAALGAMTPMPCIPATVAPWAPGSPTVLIGGMPALNNSSKLNCMWGGVIQILNPGSTTVQVP